MAATGDDRLWWILLIVMVGVLAGCSAPVPASDVGTPAGYAATPVPPATAAATAPTNPVTLPTVLATSDLTVFLTEDECPVTVLEDFQACDGVFCVRAASMVTAVDERHKILWLPQNGFMGKLVVQAEPYGGGAGLRQVLEDTLSPPEPDYPSVWQFPSAGCWRLTATAGEATGHAVVWVR